MSKDLFLEQREKEVALEKIFPTSPIEKIQDRIIKIHHEVKEGNMIAFDGLIELETLRKGLDNTIALIKEFKDVFNNELESASEEYKEGYKGYKIEARSGGKTFVYKGIPEWIEAEKSKKEIEAKYKSMFTAKVNGNPNANISEDGEELPLPEITYRKGSIILKKI